MSDAEKRKEHLVERFGPKVGAFLKQREDAVEQELAILKDPAPVSPKENKEREEKLEEAQKSQLTAISGFFQNLSSIPEAERMQARRGAESEAERIVAGNEQVPQTVRLEEGRDRWLKKIEDKQQNQNVPHGISQNRWKAYQEGELDESKKRQEERAAQEEKYRDKAFDNAWTNDEFRKESGAIRWRNHKNRQG